MIVVILAAFASASVAPAAQERPPAQERLPIPDRAAVVATYIAGPDADHVWMIRLNDSGRFDYRDNRAEPLAYRGSWRFQNGQVELEPEHREDAPYPHMPVRYIPMRWGPRLYLVPEGKVIELCNAVNLGDEPRAHRPGPLPLREGDWDKPVTGLPQLSAEWKPMLLKASLTGHITDVETDGFARLSIGGNQGLRAGMRLVVHRAGERRCCELKVVCPCEDAARVEVVCPDRCGLDDVPYGDVLLDDAFATTRAVLNRHVRVDSSLDLVFVPEMGPIPDRAPAPPVAVMPKQTRAALSAFQAVADRVETALTADALRRISRWSVDATARVQLPSGVIKHLKMNPVGVSLRGDIIRLSHRVEDGVKLPSRPTVSRWLVIVADYRGRDDRIIRVYVTIRGWARE